MNAFKRSVKNLLDNAKVVNESEEAIYIKKLYTALGSSHPYNNIHPIVKEIMTKADKAFLSTFTGKMKPIITEIIKYMNQYRADKQEYDKNLKSKII